MPPVVFNAADEPVQIAPGRGDLRYSSQVLGSGSPFVSGAPAGQVQLSNRTVSYGQIFATQPVVAAAVSTMLLGSIRVPLKLYRRDGDDDRQRIRPGGHPLADALAAPVVAPGRRGSQADLILSLFGQMEIHGSGPARVESGAGERIRFTLTDWRDLSPTRGASGRIRGWSLSQGQGREDLTVPWGELLLPHWWSPLDEPGISPLQQLGTTLATDDATSQHQKSVMANRATPSGAFKVDASVLPKDSGQRRQALLNMRTDAEAIGSGPENAGRFLLLPPGVEWQKTSFNAVEAELIKQRELSREEMVMVYHVPPPMLGLLDDATLANHQAQREMFYTDCLGGPLTLIEAAFNSMVVRDCLGIADEYYVEFDFSKVLRGDPLKEIQALREAIGSGLMTPNEGRSKLNLPRSKAPDADRLWLGTNNLSPLDGEDDEEGRGA